MSKRKSIPKALKDRLWDTTFGPENGQGPCYVCGNIINSKRFEAGHVIAFSKGGDTTLENLRCICSTCNKSMGAENLYSFKNRYFRKPGEIEEIEEQFQEKLNIEDTDYYFEDFEKFENLQKICDLCHKNSDHEKEIFCEKKNKNIYYHKKCWEKYLKLASLIMGRKTTFMRQVDCIHCLDKQWNILDNITINCESF